MGPLMVLKAECFDVGKKMCNEEELVEELFQMRREFFSVEVIKTMRTTIF